MHQKWYNMYEEAIHVPFYIRWPQKIQGGTSFDGITSHLDVIPTLLGFCDIKHVEQQPWYRNSFLNSRHLVGTDLSKQILYNQPTKSLSFFMTNDNITRGLGINSFIISPPIVTKQPTSIYAIIVRLDNVGPHAGIWKFASYVDAKSLWTDPPRFDDQIVTYKYTCIDGTPPRRATLFCNNGTCNNGTCDDDDDDDNNTNDYSSSGFTDSSCDCDKCHDARIHNSNNNPNNNPNNNRNYNRNDGFMTWAIDKDATTPYDIQTKNKRGIVSGEEQKKEKEKQNIKKVLPVGEAFSACINRTVKVRPVQTQHEMYWLDRDPMELNNYSYQISNGKASPDIIKIQKLLYNLLISAFKQYALPPRDGKVAGAVTVQDL